MDKARLCVDFNELVAHDVVLLSKCDSKTDSQGNLITFHEGMSVSIYSHDISNDGQPDNLIAEGIAIKQDLTDYPTWQHVKWCCRIDSNGVLHESDLT